MPAATQGPRGLAEGHRRPGIAGVPFTGPGRIRWAGGAWAPHAPRVGVAAGNGYRARVLIFCEAGYVTQSRAEEGAGDRGPRDCAEGAVGRGRREPWTHG